MSAFAESANCFAVNLHKVLKNQQNFLGQNLFYSPSSIVIALGMVYNGARGSTAKEISQGFYWDQLQINQVNKLMKEFNDVLNAANTTSNEISTANGLFLQEDFTVLLEFIECCKTYYDAKVTLVNYATDFEYARKQINAWVEEKTNNKIQDLLPSGSLNPLTIAALVNAIYFKGLWEKPFKKYNTFPSKFFPSENEVINVDMMSQNSEFKFSYHRGLQCQLLEMPYKGGEMAMVVILPKKISGLSDLEDKLTFEILQEMISSVHGAFPMSVKVTMPKFSITAEIKLKEVFEVMGMAEMFNQDEADLSGIAKKPLYVCNIYHKAFVDVNEEGTKAAAASAAVIKDRSPPPHITLDHPFLFLITHCNSGAVLFLGRVTKPESSKSRSKSSSRSQSRSPRSKRRKRRSSSSSSSRSRSRSRSHSFHSSSRSRSSSSSSSSRSTSRSRSKNHSKSRSKSPRDRRFDLYQIPRCYDSIASY